MKILTSIITIISALFLGNLSAEEKQKTFSWDKMAGEQNYRQTIHEVYPSLETCAYLFNGSFAAGVFRDPKTQKLAVMITNGAGKLTIKRNGKLINHSKNKRSPISSNS